MNKEVAEQKNKQTSKKNKVKKMDKESFDFGVIVFFQTLHYQFQFPRALLSFDTFCVKKYNIYSRLLLDYFVEKFSKQRMVTRW